MLLSKSYGRKNKSTLLIGEDPTILGASDEFITLGGESIPVLGFEEDSITAMPMMEGITSAGNQVAILFESGDKKYKYDGGVDPTDRLWEWSTSPN